MHLLLASQRLEEGGCAAWRPTCPTGSACARSPPRSRASCSACPTPTSCRRRPGSGYLKFDVGRDDQVQGRVRLRPGVPRATRHAAPPAGAPWRQPEIVPLRRPATSAAEPAEASGRGRRADRRAAPPTAAPRTACSTVVVAPARRARARPRTRSGCRRWTCRPRWTQLLPRWPSRRARLHRRGRAVARPAAGGRRDRGPAVRAAPRPAVGRPVRRGGPRRRSSARPQSGKSTLLRTLICSLALLHTPARSSSTASTSAAARCAALAALPHVGGVATRLRADRVRRTVAELQALLRPAGAGVRRASGIDSIAAYRRMRASGEIAGDGFGDVFLVVDGWLTLRQDFEQLETGDHRARRAGPRLRHPRDRRRPRGRSSGRRSATCSAPGSSCASATRTSPRSTAALASNVPERSPGRGLTRDGLHFLAALPRIDGQPSRRRPGRRRCASWSRPSRSPGPAAPAPRGAAAARRAAR